MATTSGEHGASVDPGNDEIVETPLPVPGPKTLLLKKQSLPWEVDARYAGIAAMLQREPYRVRFFQAVRLMERIDPKRRPVGLFVTPSAEIVQFSALPTLNFPPSELHSITVDAEGHRHMVVQFMGLNAAISVLPTPYTELLLNRIRAKDRGPSDFFDLFNHRLISLFYRGWQKYRFYIALERGAEDALTPRVMDMVGLGTAGLQRRMDIPDEACLYYAGLLGQRKRSATGLRQILEDYFRVSVQIEQFHGVWRALQKPDQTFLLGTTRRSERLGLGTIIGDEVWDQNGTVKLRLGPLPFDRYTQFLPGASAHKELTAWLRFYSNRSLDFLVQLVLEREETPPVVLGDRSALGPRLGFVSWIKNRPLGRDPDEATFLIH
ncbi:type VI secretion system baseplate subunit TssG [Granulicella sp. S156]|uniref:type VI secretion system baseplate subunit TssG n=1 Tax=Granulicella sp. S156 TaxID=1747224 RepID=UPI00131A7754|nr:type VI secretion system baseplate subunit TssG [Granulicella sp. S156]